MKDLFCESIMRNKEFEYYTDTNYQKLVDTKISIKVPGSRRKVVGKAPPLSSNPYIDSSEANDTISELECKL